MLYFISSHEPRFLLFHMCAFSDGRLSHEQMLAEIADVSLILPETSSHH